MVTFPYFEKKYIALFSLIVYTSPYVYSIYFFAFFIYLFFFFTPILTMMHHALHLCLLLTRCFQFRNSRYTGTESAAMWT